MRRTLAAAVAVCGALLAMVACGGGAGPGEVPRIIVLGFDGLDYDLTRKLMDEGRMPNFRKLEQAGGFVPLGTSVPPQSPVAWSNFITGLDAGGHGIFDFVHRDPETRIPYLSTSKAHEAGSTLKLGKYQVPLEGGEVELLRRGQTFWEVLENEGIPTTIVRMPANFPPSGEASCELTGMGTPDALGTPGTFSFYTSELFAFEGEEISGGKVYPVDMIGNVVEAQLSGPPNPFLADGEPLSIDFTAYVDPEQSAAKLAIGDEELVLQVGEWSGWVPLAFSMIPTQSLTAQARFLLKSIEPDFQLYVTPPNFDPLTPMIPISNPPSFATELAEATGRFYTQGMPEDTHGLEEGVLTGEEFLQQAELTGSEIREQYPYVLERFEQGLLFYYFGNGDMVSHMMWRSMDPEHPAYDPERDAKFADVIPRIYEQFDELVGITLERMGEDTLLVVMSDHGFTSWRRAFHLNAWLREHGFLVLKDPGLDEDPGFFGNVDWSKTKAYGLGLNGLYINLRGREPNGSVSPSEREAVMDEIAEQLLATLDPTTGTPGVTKVYKREDVYKDRGYLEIGPDIVVGYAKGWRCANDSGLGGVAKEVFSDNEGWWSGCHLMDHETVPGILLSSRSLKRPAAELKDLAGSLLFEFGIDGFPFRDNEASDQSGE